MHFRDITQAYVALWEETIEQVIAKIPDPESHTTRDLIQFYNANFIAHLKDFILLELAPQMNRVLQSSWLTSKFPEPDKTEVTTNVVLFNIPTSMMIPQTALARVWQQEQVLNWTKKKVILVLKHPTINLFGFLLRQETIKSEPRKSKTPIIE